MDVILSLLKWLKGGTIGIEIKGVQIKVGIDIEGHVTISISGDVDSIIEFLKGVIKK